MFITYARGAIEAMRFFGALAVLLIMVSIVAGVSMLYDSLTQPKTGGPTNVIAGRCFARWL